MRIRRYSVGFVAVLAAFSIFAAFAFFMSAKNAITFEKCREAGFPILQIETEFGKAIKSKDKYLGGVYALFSQEGEVEFSGNCKIRGHGNSTWTTPLTQKRSYLFKLSQAQGLFDLPAAEKWILMANACDRSMLRNFYAEYLTHNVWNKMRWCPKSQFVMLFVNGKFLGLYGVTEKVEIAPSRIEFEGEGFLAEINSREGHRPYSFTTPHDQRFWIRQPVTSEKNYKRYAKTICNMEKILYSAKENGGEWRQFFDEDSFIDWYLLAEFSKNRDSEFFNSVFMNYDYGLQKLFMGPSWDHDIAFGNTARSSISPSGTSLLSDSAWVEMFSLFLQDNKSSPIEYEGFLINQGRWFNRLFGDEEFVAKVKARWQITRPALQESIAWLKKQGAKITPAAELNDAAWHILGGALWPRAPGFRSRNTYQSELDFLVNWCERRAEWMDTMFNQ